MTGKRLLEDFNGLIRLQLTEASDKSGKYLIARGEFGRADIATQNKRKYPKSIWLREIRNIQEAIRAGKVLGELDHPADGKTSLKRVSHIMTGLDMTEDGIIIGEAKILDNEYGRQLRSILEAGGAVGVSSRGMGSTAPDTDGMEVVQDDYQYVVHDFVADPAVITSYPKFQTEVRLIERPIITEKGDSEMQTETNKEVKAEAQVPVAPVVEEKKEEKKVEKEAEKASKDAEKAAEKQADEISKAKESPMVEKPAEVKKEDCDVKEEPKAEHCGEKEPEEMEYEKECMEGYGEMGEAKLTYAQRKALPDSAFVFPKERRYPIQDLAHGKAAKARVSAHGTPKEKEAVLKAVHAKYPSLKAEDNREMGGAAMVADKEMEKKPETEAAMPIAVDKGDEGDMIKKVGHKEIWKNKDGFYWFDEPSHEVSMEFFTSEKEAESDAMKHESVSTAASSVVFESIKDLVRPFVTESDHLKSVQEHKEKIEMLEAKLEEAKLEKELSEKQLSKATSIVERLSAKCFILESLNRELDEDRNLITSFLGDITQFLVVESAEKALEEAKKKAGAKKKELKESAEKIQQVKKESDERISRLENALKESVELNKTLGLQVYLDKRTFNNPNAEQIKKICEGKTNKDEIDVIIEKYSIASPQLSDYNSIRNRLNKLPKNTTLVEDQLKGTEPKKLRVEESVESEMADLFPGSTLEQVKTLL